MNWAREIFTQACCCLLLLGICVQVHDGDTISVREGNVVFKVRLASIDCPELGQPYGQQAKQFTHALCYQRQLRLEPLETDKYGRLVATVYLPDGRNLAQEIVASGYAWYFGRFHPNPTIKQLAEQACREKTGLWRQARPTTPWKWRTSHPRN